MRECTGYKKGINFGGWLSQCVHTKEHYDTFITEKDVQEVAGWGLDHIRVPVDFELLETPAGKYLDEGFAYIDDCIAWCDNAHLNLILDLHKTAGYSFNDPDAAKGPGSLFTDEGIKIRFIRLWEQFALRYGHLSDRVCFELLNEVVPEDVIDEWNLIVRRAVEKIRSIAPDIKILIGGVFYNNVTKVKYLDEPYDRNIIYNFHCYEPVVFTHQSAYWVKFMPSDLTVEYPATIGELKKKSDPLIEFAIRSCDKPLDSMIGPAFFEELFAEAVQIAAERDVPLYCGEYGVVDNASPESTIRWYRDIHSVFEKYGIGRAAWTYKKMDFGVIDEHYAPVKKELISLL
jgi:endoglucanase